MKLLLITLLGVFISAAGVFGQNEKIRIAVFDLEATTGINKYNARAISEKLRTEIGKYQVFEVVERGQVETQVKEYKLQLSGMLSEGDTNRIRLGELLSIKLAVVGSVSRLYGTVTLNIRLINMETGLTIVSRSFDMEEAVVITQLGGIAKEIADAVENRFYGVSAKDIQISVDAGDFIKAGQMISNYRLYNGTSTEIERLDAIVKSNLSIGLIKEIRSLMIVKEFEKAKSGLEEYRRVYGDSAEVRELDRQLLVDMAGYNYEKARVYFQNQLLDPARAHITEALKGDPENRDYQKLSAQIVAAVNERDTRQSLETRRKQARDNEQREKEEKEQKEKEALDKRVRSQKHGGLDLFYNLYLPNDALVMGNNPDMHGMGLGVMVPFGNNIILYNRLTFCGVGSMGLSSLMLQQGLRLHVSMAALLDFYAQAGWNVAPQVTMISPGFYKAVFTPLRLGAFGFEGGIGFKFMPAVNFGFYCEAAFIYNNYGVSGIDPGALHISAGLSFGFI